MTVDREDILIGRVVDGEAGPDDWAELESLGAHDEDVWRRLALAQREQAALCVGLDDELEVADRVEIPHEVIHAAHSFHLRWRAWSGWAAAAVIGLVWATVQGVGSNWGSPSAQQAGLAGPWTPEEPLNEYLATGMEQGEVLGQLHTVMIDSQPAPDGDGYDVTILRRIIEVKRVNGAFNVGVDENGEVRLAPTSPVQTGGAL